MAAVSGLRNRLALTTAIVVVFGGYSRRAYADCNPAGPSTYLCSGTTTTRQQLIAPSITVTTDGTFSANVSTGTAVSIIGFGAGDISFKDYNSSVITSTSAGGAGLQIYGFGGAGSVTTFTSGAVTGDHYGIRATNYTNGALTITATGDVAGSNAANGVGIFAHNYASATDLTVTTQARVQGGFRGIQTVNNGLGATVIKTYGAVAGTTGYGIFAENTATTTDLSITTSSTSVVTGGLGGISAFNYGSGTTNITTNNKVVGYGFSAIRVVDGSSSGPMAITTNGYVRGAGSGIFASHSGTGALTINATGYVKGTGYAGIYARNQGTNLSITAADTYGTAFGMRAKNRGSGALTITSTGHATGVGQTGIYARNYYGTSLTVNAVDSSGRAAGIYANNDRGALTITSTGTASAGYYAIRAFNNGTGGGTRLTITAANTNGGVIGITAFNYGSGALTITSTGYARGTAGIGIFAINSGTSLNIDAADVSGAYAGIKALNYGSGNLSITSTGAVTASNGTGIQAVDDGPGAISVTAGGTATGMTGDGIYTNAAGTGSTTIAVLSTALVQGKVEGVKAVAPGGQSISITNQGTIQNLTGLSSDLAITTVAGSTAIVNSGLVLGTVNLGNQGGNTFDNKNGGIWSTAGGTNEFDPGPNSITNEAGATIVAANAGATAPVVTTFNGLATFTNAGTITMQNGVAGDRTVVTGNFIGQGGTVVLDTFLGADGSASDQLVLNGGTASGTTALRIVNAGGPGALTTADGIKVVDAINGATTDPTAFHLTAAVAAGAFEYGLFYGGVGSDANDQDWYLRSVLIPPGAPGNRGGTVPVPALNPSAQTTLPYADILSNYAFATLGTLQQRTGNRIWPNGPPETIWCKDPSQNYRCTVNAEQASIYANGGPVIYGAGAWGRIAGQYASYDPSRGASYTQSLGFLQAGYEGVAYEAGAGDLTVGGYATVGTSRADIDVTPDPVTGAARPKGHITTTGYGVGVNATWLGNDGIYADGIGQFTFYQSDLSNKVGGNNQGWSSALSLEAGKRFELGSGWAVVPQAQLAWTHVDFSSFIDENGSRVAIGKGDSLKGRAGLRVEKLDSWKDGDGQVRRLHLYGIANLSYEFLDGTSVKLNGTEIEQQNKRLWGEVGLGGTYAWNDKWSVYAEADYATALASHAGNDNYIVKGTAGLRYRW